MTTTNREALVIFAENVDDLKDNVKALSVAMESQVALEKQNAVLVEELSSLRKEIAVATNALATRVLEQNQGLQEIMTKNTEQAVNIFADRIAKTFEVRVNQLNNELELYQYPSIGDKIKFQNRYSDIRERVGRDGKPFLIITRETTYWNQGDEVLCITRASTIRR